MHFYNILNIPRHRMLSGKKSRTYRDFIESFQVDSPTLMPVLLFYFQIPRQSHFATKYLQRDDSGNGKSRAGMRAEDWRDQAGTWSLVKRGSNRDDPPGFQAVPGRAAVCSRSSDMSRPATHVSCWNRWAGGGSSKSRSLWVPGRQVKLDDAPALARNPTGTEMWGSCPGRRLDTHCMSPQRERWLERTQPQWVQVTLPNTWTGTMGGNRKKQGEI